MALRILGGELKGREVKSPNIASTRPVTSLLRKSIFDTCQFFIEGARVLDAFAGSGALGIEALSRGASFACFIDNNPIAARCIRENLTTLKLKERSLLLEEDAFLFLADYDKEPFDILFIDPPYPIGLLGYSKLLDCLKTTHALSPTSHIFLEAPSNLTSPLTPQIESLFTLKKARKSSSTTLFHVIL